MCDEGGKKYLLGSVLNLYFGQIWDFCHIKCSHSGWWVDIFKEPKTVFITVGLLKTKYVIVGS